MVTRPHPADPGPDPLHHARALVAEDAGEREGQLAVAHGQIGVADPGGGQPDHDLVRPGLVQGDPLQGEGGAGLVHHGGEGFGHWGNSVDGGAQNG